MILKEMYAMLVCILSVWLLHLCVGSGSKSEDICSLPLDSGACSALFMAWYYDSQDEQCRQFIYRGCGGNKNRFPSEEECYKNCKAKLISLHPPDKLSVAFATRDRIFIYWYPPTNFKIHSVSEDPGYSIAGTSTTSDTPKGVTVSHINATTIKPDGESTATVHQNSTENNNANTNKTAVIKPDQNKTEMDTGKNTTAGSNSNSSSSAETTTSPENSTVNSNVNSNDNKTVNATDKDNVTDTDAKDATGTPTLTVVTVTDKPSVTESSLNSDNKTIIYNLKDFVGKEKVPFHFAVLTGFIVSYRKTEDDEWTNKTLLKNNTEYTISNLEANTDMIIRVGALYQTNTTMYTPEVTASTMSIRGQGKCVCNPIGTVGGASNCLFTPVQLQGCRCKSGYSGLFCELCHSGYYRISDNMPCHKCPCSRTASSGMCYFNEGYLHCYKCKEGYTGTLCHQCDNGYYRNHHYLPSQCAKCRGCHSVKPGPICDPLTGTCFNCHYNTTGQRCDKCLPGFKGDPLNNINCTLMETRKAGPAFKAPSSGIIAIICVGTILAISGIVGCIIYRRMKNYPSNRPFWTIELKEGHDGVNFSSVPEHDVDGYNDDVKFNGKDSKGKSQPYARLQEDF